MLLAHEALTAASTGELVVLANAIEAELTRRMLAERAERGGSEVVEVRPHARGCLRLEKVSCGKSNCGTCRGTAYAHGPYWYLYRRSPGGKLTSKYIGKKLPGSAEASPVETHDAGDVPPAD